MRRVAMAVFAALAAVSLTHPVRAGVLVNFVNPENYHDFDTEGPAVRATMLNEIRQTFVELGATYLKPGQTLKIDVLDIDRAGFADQRPMRGDLRIITNGTPPPRFKVQYTLQQNGKTLARAQETISDINYLQNSDARFSTGWLFYEKATLRDWFGTRFGTPSRY